MTEDLDFSALTGLSEALAGVVARTEKSIVAVHSRRRFPASGFIWRPGLVVTAEEALETDEGLTVVLADGRQLPATLAGRDPSTDIALLRIDDATPALALGASVEGRPGELIVAVGRTDEGVIAHLGMVAVAGGKWRSQRGGEIDRLIRFDLRASRSAEGGVVVDARGRAAGMLVFGPRRGGLLIPSATIDRVAEQLQAKGRVPRGYLGFALQPVRIDRDHAETLGLKVPRGIMVMSVDPDGPGRRAAMHIGDVIVKWNGEPVRGVRGLLQRLGPKSVGQAAAVTYLRGGEAVAATLTVGDRPSA